MRPTRTVTVRIRRDGTVLVETDGFVGPSCADVARVIERALAPKAEPEDIERSELPSYYIAAPDALAEERLDDE